MDFQEELGETRHSEMAAGEVAEPADLLMEAEVGEADSSREFRRLEDRRTAEEVAGHRVHRLAMAEEEVAVEEDSPRELRPQQREPTRTP